MGVRVSLGSPGHQHLSDVVLCFFNAALEVRLLLLQRKQNRRFIRFNPQNHDRYLRINILHFRRRLWVSATSKGLSNTPSNSQSCYDKVVKILRDKIRISSRFDFRQQILFRKINVLFLDLNPTRTTSQSCKNKGVCVPEKVWMCCARFVSGCDHTYSWYPVSSRNTETGPYLKPSGHTL